MYCEADERDEPPRQADAAAAPERASRVAGASAERKEMTKRPLRRARPQIPARQIVPGELLFTFFRASDRVLITCELRTHREYGVETQLFENGELRFSRGGFLTKANDSNIRRGHRDAFEYYAKHYVAGYRGFRLREVLSTSLWLWPRQVP